LLFFFLKMGGSRECFPRYGFCVPLLLFLSDQKKQIVPGLFFGDPTTTPNPPPLMERIPTPFPLSRKGSKKLNRDFSPPLVYSRCPINRGFYAIISAFFQNPELHHLPRTLQIRPDRRRPELSSAIFVESSPNLPFVLGSLIHRSSNLLFLSDCMKRFSFIHLALSPLFGVAKRALRIKGMASYSPGFPSPS